jgi:hypothetical protein
VLGSCFMLSPVAGAVVRSEQLLRNAVYSRSGLLHVGVALVAMDSQSIAPCHRRQQVCLRISQDPNMLLNPDSVSGEAFRDSAPSAV